MEEYRRRYRSATDWFVWGVIGLVLAMDVWMIWMDQSWLMVILAVVCTAVLLVPFYNLYYMIDGRELVIHYMFCSHRLPIDKISEIRPVRSFLAAPALSLDRLAIKFSDRKVLRSSAPMYISPVRRQEFIDALLQVNPGIRILPKQ